MNSDDSKFPKNDHRFWEGRVFLPTYRDGGATKNSGIRLADPAPANVTQVTNWQRGPAWKCSEKQKDLILKLVEEHQLDKADVEALAVERFGKGVRLLNKVQASGLIDELLDTHGGSNRLGNSNRRSGSAYNGANGRSAA